MLALIAGTGALPPALLARLPERPLVCAIEGIRPAVTPDLTFRIEQLGSFLQTLTGKGVTEVCMAGAIRRPQIDKDVIDAATLPLVPTLLGAIAQGDDGALRAVISIFEDAGITVRAAHEIAPDLLPTSGVLSTVQVTIDTLQDAKIAEQTVADMGLSDTGQSCIVRSGRVLAREDQSGTDVMIAPIASSDDPLLAEAIGLGSMLGGAILFKAPKPDQDRRADLPVIGPDTARAVATAGLAGIVIEEGGVMVLDLLGVLAVLNAAGLFLWVRPKGDP